MEYFATDTSLNKARKTGGEPGRTSSTSRVMVFPVTVIIVSSHIMQVGRSGEGAYES